MKETTQRVIDQTAPKHLVDHNLVPETVVPGVKVCIAPVPAAGSPA